MFVAGLNCWPSRLIVESQRLTLRLSERGRLEQTLDLRVEILGDQESCLTPIGSDEARRRVVGQMHSISARRREL